MERGCEVRGAGVLLLGSGQVELPGLGLRSSLPVLLPLLLRRGELLLGGNLDVLSELELEGTGRDSH